MNIEINLAGELVGYAHLYYQQHVIDNQIDFAEFKNRLSWIDWDTNYPKYAEEIAADAYSMIIIQRVLDLLATPPV
jgi:hypothetical protein